MTWSRSYEKRKAFFQRIFNDSSGRHQAARPRDGSHHEKGLSKREYHADSRSSKAAPVSVPLPKTFLREQRCQVAALHRVARPRIIDDLSTRASGLDGGFAVPMPVRMIAYILGVPVSDMDLFKEWSDANVYSFSAGQTREGALNAARLVVDFQHYFAEKLRQESLVRPMMCSRYRELIRRRRDSMNIEECLSVISQLLVAGNETTTSTFAEGMHLLASHPEELKKVQDDPTSCPIWWKKCSGFPRPRHRRRIAKEDCEVGGVAIPRAPP